MTDLSDGVAATGHSLPDDPLELLRAARAGTPGWSETYGGPEGVALLAEQARQAVERQARDLAALRRVAIAEMCRERSLADIGRTLGISKNAVHKLHREVERQPHDSTDCSRKESGDDYPRRRHSYH